MGGKGPTTDQPAPPTKEKAPTSSPEGAWNKEAAKAGNRPAGKDVSRDVRDLARNLDKKVEGPDWLTPRSRVAETVFPTTVVSSTFSPPAPDSAYPREPLLVEPQRVRRSEWRTGSPRSRARRARRACIPRTTACRKCGSIRWRPGQDG